MVFIGGRAVYEGTTAAADPANQTVVYQQIQNAIDSYPVDIVGRAEGVKNLLGTQWTAAITNYFQHALTVGCMSQSGCLQEA